MEIKIYTISGCPFCKKTKEFLKQHKIKYKELDVASDTKARDEMIKKSKHMGVPVVDIGGKIIVGFDERVLKKTLNIK